MPSAPGANGKSPRTTVTGDKPRETIHPGKHDKETEENPAVKAGFSSVQPVPVGFPAADRPRDTPVSVVREMLPCMEGFADRLIIPEDSQFVSDLKYSACLRRGGLTARVLDQHDQDTGFRAQPCLSKA